MDACNNFLLFLTRPIVDMNKTETCMHDKCTRTVIQEMLPFGLFFFARSKIILWGIFGFVAPFVMKKLLEESSPALPSQVR